MSDPKNPIDDPLEPEDEKPEAPVEEVVHPNVIPGDPTDPPNG